MLARQPRGAPVHCRLDGGHFRTPRTVGRFCSARLPAGTGDQDPTEQVQVKDKGNNEYQAPPSSRIAEHGDDHCDPNCQQRPDRQR